MKKELRHAKEVSPRVLLINEIRRGYERVPHVVLDIRE